MSNKFLVVTHKEDIDGMGPYILTCTAYKKENVSVKFVDYNDKDVVIDDIITNKNYLNYYKVFVCDLCPSVSLMEKINQDEELKLKFKVFDHHQTNLDLNKYDFCKVVYEDQYHKQCATSLFYDYLKQRGYNHTDGENAIDDFVELTRLSDTWEWKARGINIADELNELFNAVKRDKYNELMINKLSSPRTFFTFNEEEQKIINERMQLLKQMYRAAMNNIKVFDVDGVKIALSDIKYEFRSGFSQFLRDNGFDADLLAIADLKKRTMSYRYLSDEADAGEFAKKYGGGGSKAASGSPLTQELAEKLELDLEETEEK